MNTHVVLAPGELPTERDSFENVNLFLAGSIDMGSAVDWQTQLIEKIQGLNLNVFNPRRADWDSTWVQSIENDQFYQQVDWELSNLEVCDMAVFVFDPKGQAPITLLELGLFASDRSVVMCPEGFWRKGNVDIVCERYNIPQVETLDQLAAVIRERCLQRLDHV